MTILGERPKTAQTSRPAETQMYCEVPGCVEPMRGALIVAYPAASFAMCERHLAPIQRLIAVASSKVARQLREGERDG